MMKVVIIEDEKLSASHLTILLKKADANIEIISIIDTIKSTIKQFQEGLQCDLIFMDIHLADGNCFDIFSQLNLETPIIFTTAYDNYAIQAFKQNSIDYLLKPIMLNDIQFALDKFNKQQQIAQNHLFEKYSTVYKKMIATYKTRFLVKMGEVIDTIQTNEIHHFESKESLTFLITHPGKKFIIEYSLDQLAQIISPHDFFRINRKTILHISAIEKVRPHFNGRLSISAKHLLDEFQIVSRERVAEFKKWLNK